MESTNKLYELRSSPVPKKIFYLMTFLMVAFEAATYEQVHNSPHIEGLIMATIILLSVSVPKSQESLRLEAFLSVLLSSLTYLILSYLSAEETLIDVEFSLLSILWLHLGRPKPKISQYALAFGFLGFTAISVTSKLHSWMEVVSGIFVGAASWFLINFITAKNVAPQKPFKFEFENILNIAFGTRSSFWDKSFGEGKWKFLESPSQSSRFVQIAELCNQHPSSSLNILDVGCGHGTLLKRLGYSVRYLGIDLSTIVCNENKNVFYDWKHARFLPVDFLAHDFENKNFDVIVLNAVLYYFPIRLSPRVIEKCLRLLRDETSILIVSMNRNPKALVISEILAARYIPKQSIAVENSASGSRWQINTYSPQPHNLRGISGSKR